MNSLQLLLDKLKQIAPDVCKPGPRLTPIDYVIGDYGFWFSYYGELISCPVARVDKNINNNYALDWLTAALLDECTKAAECSGEIFFAATRAESILAMLVSYFETK